MRRSPEPLVVEVLAPNLTGRGSFRLVHAGRSVVPGEADPGTDRAYRLLRLLDRLQEQFGPRVTVHLIEPLSIAWIVRAIRFRPARYPLFIVGGRAAVAGLDEEAVARSIAELLPPAPTRRDRGQEAPG